MLHPFSFALVCGIIVGSYSTVFIASPIVLFWQDFIDRRKKTAPAIAASKPQTPPRKSPTKAVK